MALISPSLIAAGFSDMGQALRVIKDAGATMVHLDVADGHFAPEVTLGQPVVASLRKATDLVLDAHLQIERPEQYVHDFVKAGADRVAVHIEATRQIRCALGLIHAEGAKAGVALNPGTPFESATEALPESDFVILLARDPGDEEANASAGVMEKLRRAIRWREERGLSFEVAIEGGVGTANAKQFAGAGADILIAGSAIFEESDPGAKLRELARLAARTRETLNA